MCPLSESVQHHTLKVSVELAHLFALSLSLGSRNIYNTAHSTRVLLLLLLLLLLPSQTLSAGFPLRGSAEVLDFGALFARKLKALVRAALDDGRLWRPRDRLHQPRGASHQRVGQAHSLRARGRGGGAEGSKGGMGPSGEI